MATAGEAALQSSDQAEFEIDGLPRSIADLGRLEDQTRKLVEEVRSCVVGVDDGSGVIVSEDGLVLTAAHVVENSGPTVRVTFAGGRTLRAKTLGSDFGLDIALVRLPSEHKWPFVDIGQSSPLNPGQWCLGLGYPGLSDRRETPIVRIGRLLGYTPWWLATDVRTTGGDSGGPLFDLEGRVIGILSGLPWRSRSSYASVDAARQSWARMANGENLNSLWPSYHPRAEFLGVSPALNVQEAKIGQVVPGAPADKAGIKPGDTIVRLDDKPVGRFSDLVLPLWEKSPNEELRVGIRRGEETFRFTLKLGKRDKYSGAVAALRGATSRDLWFGRELDCSRYVKNHSVVKAASRELVRQAKHATVCVVVDAKPVALGAIVEPDGYLVTRGNLPSGSVSCRLPDGRELDATHVGTNKEYNLALLKVESRGLDVVSWRTGGLPPVGSWVAAVGQQDDPLATGIVSTGLRSGRGVPNQSFPTVMLHDALVQATDCGGPVVDIEGKVIGINMSQVHLVCTCVIPADIVRSVVMELKQR